MTCRRVEAVLMSAARLNGTIMPKWPAGRVSAIARTRNSLYRLSLPPSAGA